MTRFSTVAALAALMLCGATGAQAQNATQSELDQGDQQTPDGMYYELAPLTAVDEGEVIGFEVNATFKPRLQFMDANQTAFATADPAVENDGGGWTITHTQTFEEAGDYYVMITSEEEGATGDFSVEMHREQ